MIGFASSAQRKSSGVRGEIDTACGVPGRVVYIGIVGFNIPKTVYLGQLSFLGTSDQLCDVLEGGQMVRNERGTTTHKGKVTKWHSEKEQSSNGKLTDHDKDMHVHNAVLVFASFVRFPHTNTSFLTEFPFLSELAPKGGFRGAKIYSWGFGTSNREVAHLTGYVLNHK